MFILVKIKDTIRIPPNLFHLPLEDAISEELNKRLANRVIVNVGLCIVLYDIVKLGESFIYQGDGASNTEGKFYRESNTSDSDSIVLQCTFDLSFSDHSLAK